MCANYKESKDYSQPVNVIYKDAFLSLHDLDFTIESSDESKGVIKASTLLTATRWGEKIEVSVKPAPNGCQVTAISQAPGFVLFDLASYNQKNVRKFFTELDIRMMKKSEK